MKSAKSLLATSFADYGYESMGDAERNDFETIIEDFELLF